MSVSRTYEEKTAAIIENLFGEKTVVAETTGYEEGAKEIDIIDNLKPKGESIDTHYTKNYGDNGGDRWVVNGTIDIKSGTDTDTDTDPETPTDNPETGT